LGPWTALNEAIDLEFRAVDKVGPDLRVLARIPGRDSF
jgi:diaminohydroxyphosphoribosylaminopyrimidine deaminase/5-amino-6-(5-phosphoribosylamino)uracil reductase